MTQVCFLIYGGDLDKLFLKMRGNCGKVSSLESDAFESDMGAFLDPAHGAKN